MTTGGSEEQQKYMEPLSFCLAKTSAHSRHYPLDPKVAGFVITNELEQEEWDLTLMQGHLSIIERLHS
ncbi:hypothetical protein CFP56_010246 [Quercus suber]|uniref:Uncharacterized protein n=1 Tax=Quercus suber TaxID=58331 RepID=A0AAW0L2J2_QUESU